MLISWLQKLTRKKGDKLFIVLVLDVKIYMEFSLKNELKKTVKHEYEYATRSL